jgi:hypothetical protein
MQPELEQEMRQLPLKQVTHRHFYQYNDAAKGPVQPAAEIKYLLPRLLELLSQSEYLHHSVELILQRPGLCDADAFSATERAALDAYALAFFADGLNQHPFDPNHRFMREDAFTILLMFDIGGFSIAPLLAYWLQYDNAHATLHYANALYWEFGEAGVLGNEIGNPFAADRDAYQQILCNWIHAPENRACFRQRIAALDADQLEVGAQGRTFCCRGPKEILVEVLDMLAGA